MIWTPQFQPQEQEINKLRTVVEKQLSAMFASQQATAALTANAADVVALYMQTLEQQVQRLEVENKLLKQEKADKK